MEESPTAKLLSRYVIFTSIVVSIFVSPWNSLDPVNLPKLVSLGFLSTIALGLTLSDLQFAKRRSSRMLLIVLVLFIVQLLMALIALFMIAYGLELCQITWHQSVPEFPGLPVGLVYGPVPLGGALTLLFLIEKVWVGPVPRTSIMFSDEAVEME